MSQASGGIDDLRLPVERRRFPRIAILKQLHSQFVSVDVSIRTCEISTGGFLIESPVAFPAGGDHEFLFTRDDGVSVLVTARAVHSRPVAVDGALHLTGFEFVGEDPRTLRVVEELIEHLRSAPDVL